MILLLIECYKKDSQNALESDIIYMRGKTHKKVKYWRLK